MQVTEVFSYILFFWSLFFFKVTNLRTGRVEMHGADLSLSQLNSPPGLEDTTRLNSVAKACHWKKIRGKSPNFLCCFTTMQKHSFGVF